MSELSAEEKRLLFVKKRMNEREPLLGTAIIKLAPIAIKASEDFARAEYINDEDRWWNTDNHDATEHDALESIYQVGCEKIQESCDREHKDSPEGCTCLHAQRVLMGMSK